LTVPARFYGHVIRITDDTAAELKTLLADFEITTEETVLDFAYEGQYIDSDHYLDEIVSIIPKSAEAHIDFIDNQEWIMERTLIREGQIHTKRVSLNDVLERYNME